MQVPDLLARRADLDGDRVALVDTGSGARRTYGEVDERASRCAAFLRDEWGIRAGDRVALLAQNTIDLFELLFGCARLGALLVPLNWRLATEELAAIVDDCRPSGLVFSADFDAQATALSDRIPGATRALVGTTLADSATPLRAERDEDQPWYLLYTSGTTGRPKGVVYTPRMALVNHINIGTAIDLTSADTTLNLLPQFHTGGINLYAMPTLYAGGTAIVQRAFDPDETLRLLADGVTAVFGVPTVYQELARHPGFADADLSGVRVWASGGAPAPVSLVHTYAARGITLRQGMGMTETGPTVFLLDSERAVEKAGSVGKPQVMVEVKAVDGEGRDVPPGEPGELLIRGPGVTPGYWERPDATEAAFTPDGWLRSGDVGRCDDDGDWYIIDRVKDVYISGGENVYPAEVERVLESYPGVQDVAVVGVPDERWGEVGAAALMTGDAAEAAGVAPDRVQAQVQAWCRDRLAGYKVPRYVVVVGELPRNATGKVLKPQLRNQLIEHLDAGEQRDGT